MTKAQKTTLKAIDKRIDVLYRKNCEGVQIDIMDIGKIFAVGRQAAVAGADDAELARKIVEFVGKIRRN